MRTRPFLMERWQSLHEHSVEINLSDSGVHPLSLGELVDIVGGREEIFDQGLIYSQTNGTPELRREIARMYAGAKEDDIMVTNGGAEANFIVLYTLLEPGDEISMMVPNYLQVAGIAESFGVTVKPWSLEPNFGESRWRVRLDELEASITDRTKMIVLCHPNNPTGTRLSQEERDQIIELARRHDAWLFVDEIYQGSDLDGGDTPTFYGSYEKVLISNSLSKAYGLPGLRLGWIVANESLCLQFWAHHDYTTISPNALSDYLAAKALRPENRSRLLARTSKYLRGNLQRVREIIEPHRDTLHFIEPKAGAMLYLQYDQSIPSGQLAQTMLEQESVLLIPGEHFGMEGWVRIGFGAPRAELEEGVGRLCRVLGAG